MDTYPQPANLAFEPFIVRDLLPICPPPSEELLRLPSLPTKQRDPSFEAPYTLSTHLIPANFLRTSWLPPVPPMPAANATKAERNETVGKAFETLTGHAARRRGCALGCPRVLWNCLNRYVKKGLNGSNGTGVTLFFAHATGFPKETWEPTLAYLLRSTTGLIDEIWAWEAVQHGDAALVNESSAIGTFDWSDNSRDIVNFLINFLPTGSPVDAPLPTHLPRIASQETEERVKNGFKDRTLVAIGHSMGGCSSALAACVFPALFSALILVDPVILEPAVAQVARENSELRGRTALGRRERWSSREEAFESFSANPFFQVWDSAAVDVYIECGTYETTDSSTGQRIVRLKTSPVLEAAVFLCDASTPLETFQRLRDLDERIRLVWIVPGKPGQEDSVAGPGHAERRVWVRPKNSTNVKIREAGHLIPMEAPRQLAENIARYLSAEVIKKPPKHSRSNL